MQDAAENSRGAADAEGEDRDAGMLDGGEAEEPPRVPPAGERESGEQQRGQAQSEQKGFRLHGGAAGGGIRLHEMAETQDRDEGDIEHQPAERGGERGRAFGVGVRQPAMQGRERGFGAVAEEQEYE